MKEPTRRGRRPKKVNRSWLAEQFLAIWEQQRGAPLVAEDATPGRSLRMIDLVVVPGKIVVRTENETGQRKRIEINFTLWNDAQWERMYEILSGRALYFGKLLIGELPPELAETCRQAGIPLLPSDAKQLELYVDGEQTDEISPMTAQVLLRIGESFSTNPFSLFQLLGRGRDECLWELKKRRHKTAPALGTAEDTLKTPASVHSQLAEKIDYFWDSGSALQSLRYSIKADEFPDALLKWLDPLPLGGLEEELEGVFEEAYIQIAKRAQAFGLGL